MKFWKSLSYTTRFSTIAFIVVAALGLLSMGVLGFGLYFTVSFLFKAYPTINDWHGDWVWSAMIGVGMLWSFGFVFGGIAWHYLNKIIPSKMMLILIYIVILWLWATFLWNIFIKLHIIP